MFCSLMTTLASHGFTLCIIVVSCCLSIAPLQLWSASSSLPLSRPFGLIPAASTLLRPFVHFCLLRAPCLSYPVLGLILGTGSLSASTVTSWRWLVPFFLAPPFHLIYGLMLSALLFTSSTYSRPLVFTIVARVSVFMAPLPVTIISVCLTVVALFCSLLGSEQSSPPSLSPVSF